jgi:hypothetical protein
VEIASGADLAHPQAGRRAEEGQHLHRLAVRVHRLVAARSVGSGDHLLRCGLLRLLGTGAGGERRDRGKHKRLHLVALRCDNVR